MGREELLHELQLLRTASRSAADVRARFTAVHTGARSACLTVAVRSLTTTHSLALLRWLGST